MTKSLDRPSNYFYPEKWWLYHSLKSGDEVLIWDQESSDANPQLVKATVESNNSRDGSIVVCCKGERYQYTPKDHDRHLKERKR